jgi:hypothetical protein
MKKRGYRYSGIGVKLTINDAGLRNADLGAIGAYFEIPRRGKSHRVLWRWREELVRA